WNLRKTLKIRTILGCCWGGLLIVACSDNSELSEQERTRAIRDRAFNDYVRERALENCEAENEEEDQSNDWEEGSLLLIDASPQCELERLGVNDQMNRRERRKIDASLVEDEPA